MTDVGDTRDSYMYRLAQEDCLKHFKYVMLVSSYQDSYAPYDSARIQTTTKALSEQYNKSCQKNKIYLEMVQNILCDIKCERLYRLDANFKI